MLSYREKETRKNKSMLGIGTKKKARGMELIDEVAGRFMTMVEELDEGINDCQIEREGIQAQIDSLTQRDGVLDSSVKRAKTIATNLRGLLGS